VRLALALLALCLVGCESMARLRPQHESGVHVVCILARCQVFVTCTNEKGAEAP